MSNRIVIQSPVIKENKITYTYQVSGEWKEAFRTKEAFFIEYSRDISSVPESIAIVPLLGNLLPMAWVYDAEIIVPACDKDFYDSIEQFKQGYKDMYPMMQFGGKLIIDRIEENTLADQNGVAAFFSGGVDAFNTLTQHADEKPTLLTVWGSDVNLEDVEGWNRVKAHLEQTAQDFDIQFVTIKSAFRKFLDEGVLSRKVAVSGDGWWHGFQHGLGIYCHGAPLAYALGLKHIYFASSFTAADRGKVTCASDPTIDNFVRFCGASIVHDGYEYTRQMKVHNITQFVKKTGKRIPLRVCWESEGGSNCCHCEKCWRTILALYAEGENPKEYGFEYANFGELCKEIHMNHELLKHHRDSRYAPVQNALRQNYTRKNVEPQLRWFYDIDISHLGETPIWRKIGRKMKRVIRGVFR